MNEFDKADFTRQFIRELSPFDKVCADKLADEVAVLIQRGRLDSRSAAGDALLDYRNPPRNERSDRIADLEAEVKSACQALQDEQCESEMQAARVKELEAERLWITTKLKLPEESTISGIQGRLHQACHSESLTTDLIEQQRGWTIRIAELEAELQQARQQLADATVRIGNAYQADGERKAAENDQLRDSLKLATEALERIQAVDLKSMSGVSRFAVVVQGRAKSALSELKRRGGE